MEINDSPTAVFTVVLSFLIPPDADSYLSGFVVPAQPYQAGSRGEFCALHPPAWSFGRLRFSPSSYCHPFMRDVWEAGRINIWLS